LNVLARLGYSKWDASQNIALFNHSSLDHEVMIDLDTPVLTSNYLDRKLKDMEINKEYFNALYNAEQKENNNTN